MTTSNKRLVKSWQCLINVPSYKERILNVSFVKEFAALFLDFGHPKKDAPKVSLYPILEILVYNYQKISEVNIIKFFTQY